MSPLLINGPRVTTRLSAFERSCPHWLTILLLAAATACGSGDELTLGTLTEEVSLRAPDVSLDAERFDGALEVMIHDDIDGSVDEHYYIEVGQDRRLSLVFEPDATPTRLADLAGLDKLQTGMPIRVYGKASGHQLVVEHLEVTEEAVPSSSEFAEARQVMGRNQPIGLGDIPVAVVLVAFSGAPNPFGVEEMRQAVYGSGRSTNAFYLAGSFGRMRLVGVENVEGGDVLGPYTVSNNGCQDGGYSAAGSAARTMAQDDGHDMGAYEKVLHYFPPNAPGCPGGGVAGGDHAFVFGVGLNGAWDYAAHELAHTFGLPHAASFTNCTSGSDTIRYGGSCGHDEYGDLTDIMGGRNFQFSSHHMIQLGWLPEANGVTLEESARVRLAPIEVASTGVQSLYVNRSGGDNYHFEFRQPLNVDEGLADGLTNGVLVRLVNGGRTTHILDMTPSDGFNDAALAEGKTYTDDGLEVTVVEVTSEAAVIDVVIDGAPVDPTVVVGGDGMPVPGEGGAPNAGGAGMDNGGAGGDTSGAGMGGMDSPAGGRDGMGSASDGSSGMAGSSGGIAPMGGGTTGMSDPLAMGGRTGVPSAGAGGSGAIPSPAISTDAQDSEGCGCRVGASPAAPRGGLAGAGLLLLGLGFWRRREFRTAGARRF